MHRFVPAIRISAIVVNYRRAEMTHACLAALADSLARAGEEYEIVVVDNGSGDGSGSALREAVPEAMAVFDTANEAAGMDVKDLCFNRPVEDLVDTEVQQPALRIGAPR